MYIDFLSTIAQSRGASTSIISDSDITAYLWLFFFLCCGCLLLPVSVVFIVNFFNKLASFTSDIGRYKTDPISRIWYRTILITPRGIMLLIGGILLLLIGISSVSFAVLSLIGIAILLIFGIVYLISQIFNIYLHIRRWTTGDDLLSSNINLKILNSDQPIKTKIKVNIPLPIGFVNRLRLILPKELGGEIRSTEISTNKGNNYFDVVFKKTRRGVFEVGPMEIEFQDLLGFTSILVTNNKTHKIKVLPVIKNIKNIEWTIATFKYGDDNSVKRIINSDDFFDMREYQRGDDIRKIHWKMSAKADKLMIRRPEITFVKSGNFKVFIDNLKLSSEKTGNLNTNFKGVRDILDHIVTVSGTVIDFALKTSNKVSVYYYWKSNKLKKHEFLNTRREEWLEKLAAIEFVTKRKTKKNVAYDLFLEDLEDVAGIFIVTADLDRSRYKYLFDIMEEKNLKINIIFIDPVSFIDSAIKLTYRKSIKDRIFDIGFSKPALEQYFFLDNIMYANYEEKSINSKYYEKFKDSYQNIKNMLSSKENVKIIKKNDDYINLLRKNN